MLSGLYKDQERFTRPPVLVVHWFKVAVNEKKVGICNHLAKSVVFAITTLDEKFHLLSSVLVVVVDLDQSSNLKPLLVGTVGAEIVKPDCTFVIEGGVVEPPPFTLNVTVYEYTI